MTHTFHVVVERDLETKVLVASVVELPGCYTQAHDLTELESNIREAIALYLDSDEETDIDSEYVATLSVELTK
ncbi:MAG: type II toxin-antitoxin system HicB family antitoxin [bacterium]|nr:type II toxin-antitoxin system HicB family antitoxin [bacterium]